MVKVYAHAYLNILVHHPLVDLNVSLILIVLKMKLVQIKNV